VVLAVRTNGSARGYSAWRGVADSPCNGFSKSTVSLQLDDTRITFDGADPGLQRVDVARGDVLKGTQGPLNGTDALGGFYRIVTNRPRRRDTRPRP